MPPLLDVLLPRFEGTVSDNFFCGNDDENFDASAFGPNCKSLPSISNLQKGRLHYIRPVAWFVSLSVGQLVGVTINFPSSLYQIRTEKIKVRIQVRNLPCLLGLQGVPKKVKNLATLGTFWPF